MIKLKSNQGNAKDEIHDLNNKAEDNRPKEFSSAVKIQAWYRAIRIRSYLKHLHKSAVEVQRQWRGYLGRKFYRYYLLSRAHMLKLQHYSSMASKIQRMWRGYYVRKYIFNFYSRKRYLEGLVVKNDIIRKELNNFAEQQEFLRQMRVEESERQRILNYAEHNHHLISTEVQPGIYNSPYKAYPDEIEFHLHSVKPPVRKRKGKGELQYDPAWRSYNLPPLQPMPPVCPKPQGPFRDPAEVQKQRYRPFNPSLRVETDFYSLEKARTKMKEEEVVSRLFDDILQPFTHKVSYYERLMHTDSKYGHIPYGREYFREEFPHRFLSTEIFKLVVPPIPILEKLNKTYSKGEV
ncbi:hypothetical protein LSAT2_031977 [Lamellibrachia satsuma]|nr:hypothetical protein LSAT2_031977 [Lamellibrachia satsuma]